jgi:hypothetical protein
VINITTFSEAGGHDINEDAVVVERHSSGAELWLCFLADGQGGRAGGALAARLACRAAADAALALPFRSLAKPSVWDEILRRADGAVRADDGAGFTTLIGFLVGDGVVVGASCGDSALLSLTGESAIELTRSQLKDPPVGSGFARFTPFSARLTGPWLVLAMSDGVWKYVGWDKLIETAAAARGQALLGALQGLARLPRSGRFPDDFALAAFDTD